MLDPSQVEVIRAAVDERLIVDAGPGTGKTFVACARLGYLISDCGLNPAQAWMISFTRAAVAEIRARLHGFIGDPSFSIKLATIDSHAWAIHSGYDPKASLTGSYEENIERVLELVREDPEVSDYLGNVEHLIVDEAQDLVSLRADLVEAIIGRLKPDCGVTVFADEAQAIYGFSEEDRHTSGAATDPFLDRLRTDDGRQFTVKSLDKIHRTTSTRLQRIFTEVRSLLLGGNQGETGLFKQIRESIVDLAHGSELKPTELGIEFLSAGSLVLFRRRAEALGASQFCAAPHSLRLSGYSPGLPPWIGACFSDWTEIHMGEQEFVHRWTGRVESSFPPTYGCEEAWSRLVRLAGTGDGSIELSNLRRQLGRKSSSVELMSSEFGLPGPIIGTIHASKGREADDVFLLVPQSEEFESPEKEEEETRVLFVGSTRARSRLEVGNASRYRGTSLPSGRCFRLLRKKNGRVGAMIEIGRDQDIGAIGVAGTSHQDEETCAAAQNWLAEHSGVITSFELNQDQNLDWNYRLVEPELDLTIAVLPDRFKDDLWEIVKFARKSSGWKLNSPSRVAYVRSLGSRTIALASDDPLIERLHAPWSRSGFMLAPRVAAFTKATMWS